MIDLKYVYHSWKNVVLSSLFIIIYHLLCALQYSSAGFMLYSGELGLRADEYKRNPESEIEKKNLFSQDTAGTVRD